MVTLRMDGLFISAVGTGVGKTLVTSILCWQLRRAGRAVAAIKPVVSGFREDDAESDPVVILRALGKPFSEEEVAAISPWRFALPASPHLAARAEGGGPSVEDAAAFCRAWVRPGGSVLLIEGAGGIMTPLGEEFTVLDLAASLEHSVVLVTGSYLGAISHTLTALSVIRARGLPVRGVVVSESIETAGLGETVEAIRQFAGDETQVCALPRLAGADEEKWRGAPDLTWVCRRDPS
jgi:dethiobiotin synthetase